MKKINQTFLGFLATTATAAVAVTSFIKLNENKKNLLKVETRNSLFLDNQEQQNITKLDFNQEQLLKIIANKFDKNKREFTSYNSNNANKFLAKITNLQTEDNSNIWTNYMQQVLSSKNGWGKFKIAPGATIDSLFNLLVNNFNVNEMVIQDQDLQKSQFLNHFNNSFHTHQHLEKVFHGTDSSGYPNWTTEWVLDLVKFQTNNFSNVQLNFQKINDFIYRINEKQTIINSQTFDYAGPVHASNKDLAKIKFDIDLELVKDENDKLIRTNFNKQKLPWDKFFVIEPNNLQNNQQPYFEIHRPKINFGLNLPLTNAIHWYGQIPNNFNQLLENIKNLEKTWVNQNHLFFEIFSGKENFYQFMNNYLFNFSNFYYDENAFQAILLLIKELNKSEPGQEIRNVIKQLMNNQDVTFQNVVIPKNKKNVLAQDQEISGSTFYISIIKENLNINPVMFNSQTWTTKALFWPQELKNPHVINQWNAYSDVILPIILEQDIFIDYLDNNNINHLGVKIYDGTKHQFVLDAIKPAAVLDGFDLPYSTTKITNIAIGTPDNRQFLGTKTNLNKKEDFEDFVKQAKSYATVSQGGNVWVNNSDFENNNKYLQATKYGIEIKFRYLANKKEIEESAWWKVQNETNPKLRMLIPDEAFDDIVDSNLKPDSYLEDFLYSDSSKEIIHRTLSRPFILKKSINSNDLIAGKMKYINIPETEALFFSKSNIGNIFITKAFKDKYNSTYHKPWWTWTFKDLVQEEKDFQNQKPNSTEVIIKNYFQEQWFNNFIANKNLANKTLEDFFPKLDEGRFFVIGSYKPSIDSTQVKLTEEAGFYFAGEQYDDYQQISNFNYVVELEVKNKTYQANLANFNLSNVNYNGNVLAYDKYQELVQLLAKNSLEYFKISSNAFKANQIEEPTINLVLDNTTNSFEPQGLGKLVIDFQKSIPIVSQIGNEVVYQQLPFELDKLKGMDEFIKNYQKYIITSQVEYDALDKLVKQKKIFIDKINNQIIIGGAVIAQEQNFMVNGILSKSIFTIPSSYWDKSIATVGFEQKTKTYLSPENALKKYNLMSQDEIFKMLFSWNTKQQADVDLLKELVKKRNVKFSFELENDNLVCLYHWDDLEGNYFTSYVSMKVIDIRPIRLDLIDKNSFNYGYQRELDTDISFTNLILKIKDIKNFVDEHFSNLSNFEKENLINGIKNIKVLNANEKEKTVRIEIALKENYLLYNKEDSLILNLKLSEKIKFSIGEFKIQNIDKKIQRELFEQKEKENKIIYLNRLDLQTKISFFKKMNFQINFNINSNEHLIENIIFKFFKEDLIANFIFNNPDIVLDAKNKININNFENELETSLNIGNSTLKNKMMPLLIGGLGAFAISLMTGMTFIFIKRKKQKADFLKTEENRETTYSDKDLFK